MGKKDHALLLACGTLTYKHVPLNLDEHCIVIANTNNKRSLALSQYNERRLECEQALFIMKKIYPIDSLCDLTPSQFEQHTHAIENPIVRSRAAHAVYENTRTLEAADLLTQGNITGFGKLMNASHASLRDLYQVTGAELDALTQAAWDCGGVLGSRMTGAGFGGCTVTLVQTDRVDRFIEKAGKAYTARTGLTADFYAAQAGDGAREVDAITTPSLAILFQ
jgi:galactokinase